MQSILATSPDLIHKAVLNNLGEIRFGPAYYSLTVDEHRFGARVFGNAYLWSPDSRLFAIQEWETISEGRGPQTHLLLIDVDTERESVLSWAEKGFIIPKQFEHDKLIYLKKYFAPPVTREFEIEFLSLSRWEYLK